MIDVSHALDKAYGHDEEDDIAKIREKLEQSTRSAIEKNPHAVKLTWKNLNYTVKVKDKAVKGMVDF